MTSFKSVSWSALVNVGNNESLALTVSGEAANPDEARDIFAFAIGQLIGVANSADEVTAPLIRAYVSRLVQTEEARPVEQDAPAPVPKKEPWAPKITKASYDARQANAAAKQDTVPATPPSAESRRRQPSHSASSHRRLHQKSPRRKLHRRKVSASVQSAARPCLRTRRNSRSSSRARRSANRAWM
jgi:hypothetical protein